MRGDIGRLVWMAALAVVCLAGASSPATNLSYTYELEADTVPFYPHGTYLASVPSPGERIGRPIGAWPVRYHESIDYLRTLTEVSDRVVLESHGSTHEGRELYNLIISSPTNMAGLEAYRDRLDQLAGGAPADPERLDDLPAVAWLGFRFHGDELSGVDAALQLAYQLVAGTDSGTMHILDNVIVIIDPIENPDGRERYLAMLETHRSAMPNYDHDAMQHQGVWPWGRTNHYWFDMNRDWALVTQPETSGRLATILKWHPQLVVDAHEMGSEASFMSDPPREPINYNTPDNVRKWWSVFDKDHAAAFDQRGWPYYIQEWHDQWYVGYGSAWATLSGSIGMLYEQARVDGLAIKQRDGYVLSFHEAVNHQFRSVLANLTTLADNRREILSDYFEARSAIVDEGQRSGLTFFFPPDDDEFRMNCFLATLIEQGIEVRRSDAAFRIRQATNTLDENLSEVALPAGSYFVSTAQPMGALAKAILEFDAHLDLDFLTEERRELERYGETRMYEISTWSLPLAYGLQAWYSMSPFSVPSQKVALPLDAKPGKLYHPEAQFGYVIDMVGERTYRMLARLFDAGLTVFASEKGFTLEGRDYQPGSLVLRRRGNDPALPSILESLAAELEIDVYGTNTAAAGAGSYLGAGTFRLLVRPRVALLAGDGMDYTSSGSLWFTIDQQIGLPHALIDVGRFHRLDLNKYNVLIVPAAWGPGMDLYVGEPGRDRIRSWVSEGGTLICCGNSAAWAADSTSDLSQVRTRRQALTRLSEYDEKLALEIQALAPEVDTMALWHPEKVPPPDEDAEEAEGGAGAEIDDEDDRWMLRFHPRGVFLRAQVDTEDWLAFGVDSVLPVLAYTSHALLSHSPVRTTARFEIEPDRLRLSGLLWPEARERWAGTSFATHESMGKGQIILFSVDPNFRAYTWGTRQLFANAVLYGPGMGSQAEDY